jgi:hypothetical protein
MEIAAPFVNYLINLAVMGSLIAFSSNAGVLPGPILSSFEPVIGIPLKGLMCTSPLGIRSK